MGIVVLGGPGAVRSWAQMPQLKRPEEPPEEKPAPPPPKKLVNEPRAVGLLQLNKSGKGTLIPIAIRIDGKFYDASAYKANPVPMALDGGTVYEVEKTGQSQGLFTVSGALHNQNPNSATPWLGAGQYVLNGTVAANKIHRAEDKPRGIEGIDNGPPRLTRGAEAGSGSPSSTANGTSGTSQKSSSGTQAGGPGTGNEPSTGAGSTTAGSGDSGAGSGGGSSADDDSGRPQLKRAGGSGGGTDQGSKSQNTETGEQGTNSGANAPKASSSSGQSTAEPGAGSGGQANGGQSTPPQSQAGQGQSGQGQAGEGESTQNQSGQNYYRPVLRRGKPTERAPEDTPEELTRTTETASPAQAAGSRDNAGAVKPAIQLVPAISDAGGPLPESFQFFWKESEEADRQKQMEELAADSVRTYLAKLAKDTIPAKPAEAKGTVSKRGTNSHKPAEKIEPAFEDIEFRAFDVWRNNQPVMVLTAEAHLPQKTGADANPTTYYVTLAARTDIYGDLRKLYSGVTDKFHLDVTPKLELIDALDADGDGRGELLFRETTDAGNGYLIYRPTGDTLWKMFDSLNQE